ncbi:Fibrinogen C domain-containing protein 1 [Holothuria leucospilota]|uniref:Fibrinogen C domain-containing protein 1 n=1 Tax=Holothuria leucospilota TaxID=206669 RepID=A0A9Q1HCP0_HOLLE|nr:Fibrinogen C domain-containing protein 1 [Holothuria leucospilota]
MPASSESYIVSTPVSTPVHTVSITAPCPPNMIYSNCSNCQATCELPKVNAVCYSNCSEGCACANGLIQQGPHNCVSPSECSCFVPAGGFVLADGVEGYVNENCTQQCNCSNGHLKCDLNYKCDPRANCELREPAASRCYCIDGYVGDGKTCLPYSDCGDAYISGHRKDGTYVILPVGWPGQPFNVSCDMTTNGGGWTVSIFR